MEPVERRELSFTAADGTHLAADLTEPTACLGTAVVCHPHPRFGGTRHDAVVAAIHDGLIARGHAVLRFDFRGAGDSGGTHDDGRAERLDVEAAIDEMARPDLPLVLAGYSFGADLALAVTDARVARWVVVAPVLMLQPSFPAATDPRPKHLVCAAHDQFRPAAAIDGAVREWRATTVTAVESADHFFGGALHRVTSIVSAGVG